MNQTKNNSSTMKSAMRLASKPDHISIPLGGEPAEHAGYNDIEDGGGRGEHDEDCDDYVYEDSRGG